MSYKISISDLNYLASKPTSTNEGDAIVNGLLAIAERLELLASISQLMSDRFESIDIALGLQEIQLRRIADALEKFEVVFAEQEADHE